MTLLKSIFINLFDIKHKDPAEHFLLFSLLSYLYNIAANSNSQTYVKVSNVISYLTSQGFTYSISKQSIKLLMDKSYIHTFIEKDSIEDSDDVIISTLGKYHISNLISEFQYLDATIIDTPILDDKIRSQINNVSGIRERLHRTKLFLEYLNSSVNHVYDLDLKMMWQNVYNEAHKRIKKVEKNLEKNNK